MRNTLPSAIRTKHKAIFCKSSKSPRNASMDAPSSATSIIDVVCKLCSARTPRNEARLLSERNQEETATGYLCQLCYVKGEFRARCSLCKASEKCAPWLVGSSTFVCMACQWRPGKSNISAEIDNKQAKSVRR